MKQLKFFAVGVVSICLMSCQQPIKETRTDEKITDSLDRSHDVVSARDTVDTIASSPDSPTSLVHTDLPPKFAIREGKHSLSLQWISWEKMGEVEIKHLGDNKYSIEGEQRNQTNDDYLKIKGTLAPISEKELIFDGTVEHQISHLNQGQPCVKNGKQIFKSTKNRKYWRMQDMQNCEGGMVTDYIDIYF